MANALAAALLGFRILGVLDRYLFTVTHVDLFPALESLAGNDTVDFYVRQ